SILPFKLIGILILVFWLLLGFITCKIEKTPYHSALFIHIPALIALLLIMYQDIVLERFWSNMIGIATQFYFLPLIHISGSIGGMLSYYLWSDCLIAFLLMYGSYSLGSYLKKIFSK